MLLLGLLGLAAPRQAAAQDPRDIRHYARPAGHPGARPERAAEAQRLARFRELFRNDFDLPGIGQFVLGRYWRIATPQEQQEFLGLFQEYLVRAYSARLGSIRRRAVPGHRRPPERRGNDRQQRNRAAERRPVRLDWYLIDGGGRFMITDVYVGGISMKVTQRDEFSAVIQRSGGRVAGLLAELRQKLAAG